MSVEGQDPSWGDVHSSGDPCWLGGQHVASAVALDRKGLAGEKERLGPYRSQALGMPEPLHHPPGHDLN